MPLELSNSADLDAARRLSDEVDFQLTCARWTPIEAVNRWIAARLSDGASDHVLYDEKADAVRLAPSALGVLPRQCLYVQIPLTGMPVDEALGLLRLWRQDWLDTTAPVEVVNPYAHHPLTDPRRIRR